MYTIEKGIVGPKNWNRSTIAFCQKQRAEALQSQIAVQEEQLKTFNVYAD